MASHDMRTPLQAILGNIQLARRRLARAAENETATAELARNLANAERTTDKLTRLVAELMDVSMLRSGQNLPLEPRVFHLRAIASQVAEDHQSRTERHRIQVTGEESLVGEWDQGRVERVLDNLVDNAVKYSPGGGDVIVEVASEEAHATVSVTDHGIGIPASELGGIFEPYRRGSNARMLRGIGLGLAGCRAVLEQLGGELIVESTEGVGSTFRVRLPKP
jgi:signal transduction histidine kinase